MPLSLKSVLEAARANKRIYTPLTESHITLYYECDAASVDLPSLEALLDYASQEFGINLVLEGGGAGCVRFVLKGDPPEAVRQMVTSDAFRKLANEAGIKAIWVHEPSVSIPTDGVLPAEPNRVEFGIITPLAEEFKSLRAALKASGAVERRISIGVLTFYKFSLITYSGTELEIVATFMSRMGNDSCAITTFQLIANWNPKFLILTGIAGAVDKKLSLGHVVVVDEVMRFDRRRKEADSGTSWAPTSYSTDRIALNRANAFLLEDEDVLVWQRKCEKNHRDEQLIPKATIENIACGDAVVDSEDLKAEIVRLNRTCKAVEMEAGGFLEAIINQSVVGRAIVVRGLSDYAANKSETDADPTFDWRQFAASNAATFVVEFLRTMHPFETPHPAAEISPNIPLQPSGGSTGS